MYSPISRVLTVLELLQSHRRMTGSELARRLEVDGRTVRRYISTLQEMGIPIEGERGPYGAYELRRGVKMAPLMFNDAEVVALTLGLLSIREYGFPAETAAVEGSLAKIERVMPERLAALVRGLQETISFVVSTPRHLIKNEVVSQLSLAVQQRKRVWMHYRSWRGIDSEREFDPYGIVINEGYWYVTGYCHVRKDIRTFRVDRILELQPRSETFEYKEDFDAIGEVLHSLAFIDEAQEVEVFLETSFENAQNLIPPVLGTLERSGDGVIFRRTATQLDWIAHVLIGFDFPVKVVKPDELRNLVQRLGEKAIEIAGYEK